MKTLQNKKGKDSGGIGLTTLIFIVFFAVLILSLVTSLIIHTTTVHLLQEEIIDKQKNTIAALAEENMKYYGTALNLLRQWSLDSEILRFDYDPKVDALKDRYWYVPIWQKIKEVFVFHPYLHGAYMYYPGSDVVIHNGALLWNEQQLYDEFFREDFSSVGQWKSYLASKENTMNNQMIVSTEEQSFLILWGKGIKSNTNSPGPYIFLAIDTQELLQTPTLAEDWIGIYLLSDQQEIINQIGQDITLNFTIDPEEGSGVAETEDLLYIYSSPSITNTRYMIVYPRTVILQKVRTVRLLTISLNVLYTVIAVLVIALFVLWNRRQMDSILETASHFGATIKPRNNEFQSIKHVLTTLGQDKNEIEHRLQQHSNLVRNRHLQSLLQGEIKGKAMDVDEINQMLSIDFQKDTFAVAIVTIGDYETSLHSPALSFVENMNMLHFAIKNIFEEILSQDFSCNSLDLNSDIVFIVSTTPAKEAPLATFQELLEQSLALCEDLLEVTLWAVSSTFHPGGGSLQYGYQEALQAQNSSQFTSRPVVTYEEIKKTLPQQIYQFSLVTEQQIINLIRSGKEEDARQMLSTLLQENEEIIGPNDPIVFQLFLYDITNLFIKANQELQGLYETQLEPRQIFSLTHCDTFEHFSKKSQEITQRLCAIAAENQETSNSMLRDVEKYVLNNYNNPDLNLYHIGEQFHMSAYYISRLFKEATNVGLLDYIHKTRIEKAKQLLKRETHSAQEISGLVGYNDYTSFARVFKRQTGLSPQQYRDNAPTMVSNASQDSLQE